MNLLNFGTDILKNNSWIFLTSSGLYLIALVLIIFFATRRLHWAIRTGVSEGMSEGIAKGMVLGFQGCVSLLEKKYPNFAKELKRVSDEPK